MTIAVLPLNAGPNTRPALARQLANFACDIVRNNTGAEVNAVNYLVQLDQQGPQPKFANVNASEALNESQMIEQLFGQTNADKIVDGLLVENEGKYDLTYRVFKKDGGEEPTTTETIAFDAGSVFKPARMLVETLAKEADKELPAELNQDENLFGTSNGEAFLKFLESYDALQYIEKTQGQVADEFSPIPALDTLAESAKLDTDWEAPYVTLVQLSRAAVNYRIGDPAEIEKRLKDVISVAPNDGRGHFALGELYQAIGNLQGASDAFEKAAQLEPDEPAILSRLGLIQIQMGMPVNAERNFRKAVEMEDENKPSLDFLANVLVQTGRAHEVPPLWKERVEAVPENPGFHAKLAISYLQADQEAEAVKVFEEGLKLEDNVLIKRYYAPFLAQKEEVDRAMDFYEDCLEAVPNDIQVMLEYAQTLQAAGRDFEIPKVLKDVLAASPDNNTRAQVQAWLTELEQPKRVETVTNAQKKLEQNDFEGALRDLRPMKNWLGDYWKMWLLLSAALNRTGNHEEAEQAATTLIEMFPQCEQAYGELAAALGGQGKNDQVYNAMRFGLTQVQGSIPIGLNLALAAKRLGNTEEAREIARQIREAVGANPDLERILKDIEE
ncbi:MAG: hypothetical protein JST40_12635 [Armatimonadetes bacterium]|nr:hypothetical protein [Armatimonadota bacterium]